MALPEQKIDGLRAIVKDAMARVTQIDGGKPAGAAFRVSDTLLVTNRHVVGDGVTDVLVHAQGTAEPVNGRVLPASDIDPALDIALIEVPRNSRSTAVVLHPDILDGQFVVFGYPKEDFYVEAGPGAEALPIDGHTSDEISTGRPKLLRLTEGQIKPGFSGGPVLSARTGAVVAVTVYSEDPAAALGGGSLPVWRILDAYPQLRTLAAEPPPQLTSRWRDVLEQEHWESLGLTWDPSQQVDIYLSGDRSCWRIAVRKDEAGPERTVRDLGDDMAEVLVRWARSSGRREESEVRLLGKLLSAAIFPKEIADHFPPPATLDRDPILVRLHVDPDGPLAELPWEFATDPAHSDRFLAATDGYAFVRVGNEPRVRTSRLSARVQPAQVNVLGIVIQPDETIRWPSVIDTRLPRAWPTSDQLEAQLREAVETPSAADGTSLFKLDTMVNPTLSRIGSRVQENRPIDIVHFIGFGYREPPDPGTDGAEAQLDRTMMAFAAGAGYDDLRYHKAGEVLRSLAALQPAIAIFEFGTPPLDERLGRGCEPIAPALLSASAPLGVDAMICTRQVHPMQYGRFNAELYSQLGAGQTVEKAVQMARQVLLMDQPVDFAGFGWFMATTGNTPRRRLFAEPRARGEALSLPTSTTSG